MINIPLQAIPNQSLSILLDQTNFDIRLFSCGQSLIAEANIMTITVYINNVLTVQNIRVVPGTPIIPYNYLITNGNFVLLTQDNSYANYEQFGVTQNLIYASQSEIRAIYASAA